MCITVEAATPTRSVSHRILVLLAFLAFISLGLPDTLLGVAWPSITVAFQRPLSDLGFLLIASTIGYLSASFSGGTIVRRFGVGPLLVGSTILVTIALGGNALAFAWPMMLVCALIGGLGAGAIDTGINLYAAARFSPRVVNWLHASWGIGATAGPLIMTLAIAGHLGGWRVGYGVIAVALGFLAAVFIRTRGAWNLGAASTADESHHDSAGMLETIGQPIVQLQVLFYFLYGGVESSAGAWLYTLLTESRAVPFKTAGTLVGAYWGMLTLGRIVFGQVAVRLDRVAVMRVGLAIALVASPFLLYFFSFSFTSVAALLIGFGLAPLYPTLMSITPTRVGPRFAHHAVGFQVAACASGIAVWPTLLGFIARRFGLEIIPTAILLGMIVLVVLHEFILRRPTPQPPRGFDVEPITAPPPPITPVT